MDRVLLVATLIVAAGFAYAGHALSGYVGSMNTARVVGAVMTAPMGDASSAQTITGGIFGMLNNAVRISLDQRKAAEEMRQQREALQKQAAVVEVISAVWRYVTWGAAAGLAATALLGWWTARSRAWLLIAAAVILLSTVATLVCMWMLMAPDLGGMPPLHALTYVYVAAVQSAYGWLLLLMLHVRRRQLPVSESHA